MRIRQYVDSDLAEVLSAWEGANSLAHPFMTEEFLAQERKNLPELYLPNADTWVIETAGEVVGFIALIGNEVGGLFVLPMHHGKGAGLALMNKAQELHGELVVEVFAANTIGRNFYAEYGFEQIAELLHEATGQPLLRLKLTATHTKPQGRKTAADAYKNSTKT